MSAVPHFNPMHGPVAERIIVTPAMAQKWLEFNVNNRPLKPAQINFLVGVLQRGEWKFNGEAIRFSACGRLMNGQHRLWACVRSGIPIDTLVVRGLSMDAFPTMDTGIVYGAENVFACAGHKNTKELKSAILMLSKFLSGNMGTRTFTKLSTIQFVTLLKEHPGIEESVTRTRRIRSLSSHAVNAFCHYLFGMINAQQRDSFFLDLEIAANLRELDPILKLREFLVENNARRVRWDQAYIVVAYFKTWNARMNGQQIKQIRFNRNQEFPKLVGWDRDAEKAQSAEAGDVNPPADQDGN